MHTEDFSADHSGEREVVKYVGAVLPGVTITVFALALVVESVDLGDLATLVVSAEECHVLWVPRLEEHEERETLETVVATVNIVTHENVVGAGTLAALVEELKEVVELAVDVATDSDRGRDRLHIGLFDEDFLHIFAEQFELILL